jgi:hypothetical protein
VSRSSSPAQALRDLLYEALGDSIRDAILVTVGCALTAVVVNTWLHPDPIPFITTREYEILVPCPEPGGKVIPMEADDPRLDAAATFIVDARPPAEYARWHLPGALNMPYSYLDPTPPDTLRALARAIARSHARQAAVYGDGDDPDTGELLGREISGHGIRHVFFVRGGAPALMAVGESHTAPQKAP